MDGQAVQILENLGRELSRGREDERARRPTRLCHQLVEDRQKERRRLAAAGHRTGEQIAALERRRDRIGLNGRGLHETEVFDSPDQVGVELEVAERHGVLCRNEHLL